MSRKSTKPEHGSKSQQGSNAKSPAKFEGAVPESRPASAAKPAWSPRPRTADRTAHPVPAAQAPVAAKGVVNAPQAKAAVNPAQAPARVAAPVANPPAPAVRGAAPAGSVAPAAARAAAPSHEEIARVAHDLWAQRGSPVGQDIDIWCEAERRLTRKS